MTEQNTKARHIIWDQMPVEAMNPLITRQFVSGEQITFARLELKKGSVVPEHKHHNEQIAFILSGALQFRMNEETVVVRGGQALLIPANVPHSAEALEDTVNVDIFSPTRQDWVSGDDAYLRK